MLDRISKSQIVLPEHLLFLPSGHTQLYSVSLGSATHSIPSGQGLFSHRLFNTGHLPPKCQNSAGKIRKSTKPYMSKYVGAWGVIRNLRTGRSRFSGIVGWRSWGGPCCKWTWRFYPGRWPHHRSVMDSPGPRTASAPPARCGCPSSPQSQPQRSSASGRQPEENWKKQNTR